MTKIVSLLGLLFSISTAFATPETSISSSQACDSLIGTYACEGNGQKESLSIQKDANGHFDVVVGLGIATSKYIPDGQIHPHSDARYANQFRVTCSSAIGMIIESFYARGEKHTVVITKTENGVVYNYLGNLTLSCNSTSSK